MEEISSGPLIAALIVVVAKHILGHMRVDVKQSSNNILHTAKSCETHEALLN
jgi:hypothetical protein